MRCERCAALVYGKRYARTLRVCPECGAHGRLTARQRLDQLLDPGSCRARGPGGGGGAGGAAPPGGGGNPPRPPP
ncbi:hypothetical protein ACFV3E_31535, partial [Streptomyces sp. NPDC059718]